MRSFVGFNGVRRERLVWGRGGFLLDVTSDAAGLALGLAINPNGMGEVCDE